VPVPRLRLSLSLGSRCPRSFCRCDLLGYLGRGVDDSRSVLVAASTAAGPDGDRLVATTYIQRIRTTGGHTPPAADCNAATAGTVAEVPYTADYYFWKKTAS
jgi:hypothetical protein